MIRIEDFCTIGHGEVTETVKYSMLAVSGFSLDARVTPTNLGPGGLVGVTLKRLICCEEIDGARPANACCAGF